MDSDLSETRSQPSESYSDASARGWRSMSSVSAARTLTRDLGDMLAPTGGWKAKVNAIHRGVERAYFDLTSDWRDDERSAPTWNQVKSWFYGEARRIDYAHMRALQELKAQKEAQLAHQRFVTTTAELAKVLASAGTSLSSHELDVLRRIAERAADLPRAASAGARSGLGGMDLPGAHL